MTRNSLPSTPMGTPQVVIWMKVYAGVMCVVYLLLAAVSIIFFAIDPSGMPDTSLGELRFLGALFLVMGLFFFVVFLLPILFPPRPWVWVYDLVIICLGLTSPCLLPFCVPLLIFWFKPETKAYFGKA
ncbi:hypothetical protein BST81_20480 [Leptolyngbya sp. 'hensonii']|uniref:hypothetical protein n=1 Tax=Leptolyngbya sp. 'hensonii' TaxID=1922337 RepID=UPI000959DFE4|nr:hypothetical protein [Leptolyngbya sp. 'hensonii']OLP16576.1 hypothetical protein BST81_20480 [Leptolyngbya sp. 'hensonii']